MNSFFNRKFLNSWSISRTRTDHPLFRNANQGDVVFIYNDKTSKSGRKMQFVKYDKWYFYIKNNEKNRNLLEKSKRTKYQIGKDWIRIYYNLKEFKDQNLTKFIKDLEARGIETFEADLSPMKRLCIDQDVQIDDFENVRVLYFDIETDDSKNGIEIGRDRILSFAAYDQNGKSYYLTNKDEKTLLYDIDELLCKYDMIVGWNSYQFDLPYLKARYKLHKVPADYLYNMLHEDMMKRVFYFYSKEPVARQEISSYSLEYISQYFLKEGKVKHSEKVIELFNRYPEKLKEYNLRDAELLMKLEKKLGTIGHTYRLFQMCQVFAQNWSMVKSIDNFILVDANKKGIHYKTNMNAFKTGEEPEVDTEYVGALVLDPVPGYYKNVYDLDFRSLYPNIIRTFNLSPETLITTATHSNDIITTPIMEINGIKHGGHKFLKEEGIVPGKIGILLDERNKLKKTLKNMDPDSQEYKTTFAKQWVTKDLANSFYGVLGNQYFRSYNHDAVEAITITGQFLLTWVADYINKTGRKAIYGDTDSIFAQLKDGETVEDALKEINTAMTKMLIKDYNVKNSTLELGFDCKFDTFLIEAKKKYTGLVDGKLRSRGMELVKRDTIALAVASQKELLDLVFKDKSIKSIQKWLDALKLKITEGKIEPEQITFRKRINKDPKTYKSKPLHVILAEAQGHGAGEIVQYIITDGSKKLEGVTIDKFNGNFDRTYYWNSAVYTMLERILIVAFPKEDWSKYYIIPEKKVKGLLPGHKQTTIFDFIKSKENVSTDNKKQNNKKKHRSK